MLLRRVFRRLAQGGIVTIPNALTLFRLLLIPVFVHFFFTAPASFAPLMVLSLSALSDVLDGFIARRFAMVSDFGKFLDPLADKLTQATLLLCLSLRYAAAGFLLGLLVIKELAMGSFALLTLERTDGVHSARWHGKLNSTILEASLALMLLPNFPTALLVPLILLCSISMFSSLLLYTIFFSRILTEGNDAA